MSRTHTRRMNQQLIKQNYLNSFPKSSSFQNIGLQPISKSQNYYPQPSMMTSEKTIRLNIINKQNESERISIIAKTSWSISQLKRKIEAEFYQLHSKSLLIKVLQDSKGFIFSNNSLIGDYVQGNDTIYIVVHKQKQGNTMNLPSNITDIFMTLRFVTKSVVKKLTQVKKIISLRQVLSELVCLGFWYSNTDLIVDLLKLVNEMMTKEDMMVMEKGAGEVLDNLIIKFINFWIFEISSSAQIYPDVFEQVLTFVENLSMSQHYSLILKNTKIIKKLTDLSKSSSHSKQILKLLKNLNGKARYMSAPTNLKLDYNPTSFLNDDNQENIESYNLEEVLEMISDKNDEENSKRALEIFAETKNKLVVQASVRFDYYWKIIDGLMNARKLDDRKIVKQFAIVMEEISKNTSESRAIQLFDKNILKKLHDFLLQSPIDLHKFVLRYITNILSLTSKSGQLSIKKVCQLFSSPYQQFLITLCEALQRNNQFHSSSKNRGYTLLYINNIKDFIRLALKSQNPLISRPLLKILSNLSLDEQCRYQILNLKGIQIFVKLLQTNKDNIQIQRVCAKGLLNLALSSKQVKVKVLAQMTTIIEGYYRREFDSIATGYIQTILKTTKV